MQSSNIFWGLKVAPNKRYQTIVEEPFRITKACLEPCTAAEKVSSLYLKSNDGKEFIIANLSLEIFNESLDLSFSQGENICFKVEGPGTVHLSGNLEGPTRESKGQSESEDESSDDESESSGQESSSESPRTKVILEDKVEKKLEASKVKLKAPVKDIKAPNKTVKHGTKTSDSKGGVSGVLVEDLVEGHGQTARRGNGVGLYYKGWLQSNSKVFDACLSGKPFKFKLGSGQVIAGWDKGVAGMKVGGKRRLTISPLMGYGSSGAPPRIPPNATLVFDVECKFVKAYGGNNIL